MYRKITLFLVCILGMLPLVPNSLAAPRPNLQPVSQSSNDFSLTVSPPVQTIQVGSSTSFTIQVGALGSFNQAVGLSLAVMPSNARMQTNLSNNFVAPGGNAVLTVSTTAATTPAAYTFLINGIAGSLVHTALATVVVQPVVPDFALGLPASPLVIKQKTNSKLTVDIIRLGGFAGPVTVTAPDTRMLKRLKLVLAPGEQTTTGNSVTFNFNVQKKAVPGTYELIFTGRDTTGSTRLARLTVLVERGGKK